MAGGVGVKANVYVEKWAHMREHVELGFKFKNRMGTLAVFAAAVPLLVYSATVGEFVRPSPVVPLLFLSHLPDLYHRLTRPTPHYTGWKTPVGGQGECRVDALYKLNGSS
jgi:hypothetical protein